MNARPAAWEPDPSGRHEYRYWDGTSWTDDVADQGVTSVDPVGAAGPGADPTAVLDATRPYAAPGAGYGAAAPPGYGPPPGGQQPAYGTFASPSGPPRRSGPSTGLLVGLAALAIAVIVGLVVVATGGDDGDDTATDDTSTSATDDTATDDTASDTGDTGDTGDSGDSGDDEGDSGDSGDGEASDELVAAMADSLVATGMFDQQQAECFAEVMLEEIGIERMAEIGASGGDLTSLTSEEMTAIFDGIGDCGLTGLPTDPGDLESDT
jgi:hypothetical protein